jgi:hypothetical protein
VDFLREHKNQDFKWREKTIFTTKRIGKKMIQLIEKLLYKTPEVLPLVSECG